MRKCAGDDVVVGVLDVVLLVPAAELVVAGNVHETVFRTDPSAACRSKWPSPGD